MKKMHVAILFEYSSLNGGERSMLAVIDELQRADLPQKDAEFRFSAIGLNDGNLADELAKRQIALHPISFHSPEGTRLPPDVLSDNLAEIVANADCDILHANSLAMSRLTGQCGDKLPCVKTGHLRDIMKISRAAMADLNRNDRLAAVSDATRDFHIGHGLDSNRVSTVYNGVDIHEFVPRKRTGQLCRELNLNDDAFLVLSVGQIGLRKAVDVLAEAAADVCRTIPNAHFVVVGERHSQKQESIDFENNVDQRMANAGYSDRWHRLGRRNDVATLMNEADVLVHAAHQEPLGRVLLEAAASGLPIIATDVGGTAEILFDGVSARLVKPGCPTELSSAIYELHSNDEQQSRFCGKARQVIESKFTVSIAADSMASFWKSTLGPKISHSMSPDRRLN